MNWAIFLSNYGRPILNEELPLKILAMLERRGLTTEPELATQLRTNESVLNDRLLDLYKNECVHITGDTVRVSRRGKEVLERFKLDQVIVEDLVRDWFASEADQKTWEDILLLYRDKAFDNYLNSIASCRVFLDLCSAATGNEQSDTEKENSHLGIRTLLVRDLRNWFVHRRLPPDSSEKLNEVIGGNIGVDLQILPMPSEPRNKRARLWLECLDATDNKHLWERLDHTETSTVNKLVFLTFFQEQGDINAWYDGWHRLCVPLVKKHKNEADLLAALKTSLGRLDTYGAHKNRQVDPHLPYRGYWRNEP